MSAKNVCMCVCIWCVYVFATFIKYFCAMKQVILDSVLNA